MNASPFTFVGETLTALPTGALWWPDAAALVVADLHLEKGSAFARRGVPLPPYDSRATIGRLAALITALRPAQVICLGDSFHDPAGPDRLDAADRSSLQALTDGRRWIWVGGNHDGDAAASLGGEFQDEFRSGPIVFRHEAAMSAGGAAGEISGHFHPKASVALGGRRHTGRCFVGDGRRLILPAFGAYTGGLDVFDPAIAGLLAASFSVRLLGRHRLHALPSNRLSRPPVSIRTAAATG